LSRKGASRPSELKKSTLSSSTASRNSYASDILPHRIDEIITAAIQRRIDCQEVMLLRLATTFGPLRHLILAHPN
jgi:hypothetical protein